MSDGGKYFDLALKLARLAAEDCSYDLGRPSNPRKKRGKTMTDDKLPAVASNDQVERPQKASKGENA